MAIEDPHERTRAVLWMLCDIDPQLPLVEALGYLKALESYLEIEEARRERLRKTAEQVLKNM